MKTLLFMLLTFPILVCVPHTVAQDLSQKHLPEGAIARLGKGNTMDVEYSPDGTRFAVASGIGIWVYDAQTHQEINLLTEHSEFVWSVAFSPDGQTLAGGSGDRTVRLWDANTGQQRLTLKGHRGGVNSVAFSPDGQTLASVDFDEVGLWDANTGQRKATLKGHRGVIWSVAFSPDGQTLASGSWDNTVGLWDANTGQRKITLTKHTDLVWDVAFSPDGQTLASGSWDKTVRLWDVDTGQQKTVLTVGSYVECLEFSPDGQTLVSGRAGKILLWDTDTWQRKTELEERHFVYSFAFSPDGQTLISAGNGGLLLWDTNTGQRKATIKGHRSTVEQLAFSSDGQTLVGVSSDEMLLWDTNTGQRKAIIKGLKNTINSIAFSPDGQMLASASNSMVGFQDEDTGARVRTGEVLLWDANTGQRKATLRGHKKPIKRITFSLDGRTFVSASHGEVLIWDTGTWQQKTIIEDPDLNDSLIAISPNGGILAGGSKDSTILRLWDTSTGKPLKTLTGHTGRINNIAFSPDGSILATESSKDLVALWDIASGQLKGTLPIAYSCLSSGVAFSPDGGILATGGSFWDVALWNVTTGRKLKVLAGHGRAFSNLVFSPNGNILATGGMDGTVLLWDVPLFISTQQFEQDNAQQDIVRLIYFRPSDRPSRSGINGQLDTLIRGVQQFYAEQMQRYGSKTFTFETDENGKVVVHHMDGEFADGYYHNQTYDKVEKEISRKLVSGRVYLAVVDVSSEFINDKNTCGVGGGKWYGREDESWRRDFGGLAVIPASGKCFNVGVTAHELGHTFALEHDFRDDTYLMAYGTSERLSHCATEWLNVHRYFNTNSTEFNQNTTIEMSSQLTNRLYFQLTDADGLHQAQLLIPTTTDDPAQGTKLHGCRPLQGQNSTIAFVVPKLIAKAAAEVTLQVIDVNGNITRQEFQLSPFKGTRGVEPLLFVEDANQDGEVDTNDWLLVAGAQGENPPVNPHTDVNGDGKVDVADILVVAGAIGADAGAPSVNLKALEMFTASEVQLWLTQARQLGLTDARYQRGILYLQSLLATLIPKETALLPNYPNPFNPETWIPYQLANPAAVTVSIYATDGKLVRRLVLGHQTAGIYVSRNRAAYWDGKNTFDELVASGVYFYSLTAGDFTATRKMIIQK